MSEWIWEDKVPRDETSYVFPIFMLIIFLYDTFLLISEPYEHFTDLKKQKSISQVKLSCNTYMGTEY